MRRTLIVILVLVWITPANLLMCAEATGLGMMRSDGGLDLQIDLQTVVLKDGTTFVIRLYHIEDIDSRGVYSRFLLNFPGVFPDVGSERSTRRHDCVVFVGTAKFKGIPFYAPTDMEGIDARDRGNGDIILRIRGIEHRYLGGELSELVDLNGYHYRVRQTGTYGLLITGTDGEIYANIREVDDPNRKRIDTAPVEIIRDVNSNPYRIFCQTKDTIDQYVIDYSQSGLIAWSEVNGKRRHVFNWRVNMKRSPEYLRMAPAILQGDGESEYRIDFTVFGNHITRLRHDGSVEKMEFPERSR